MARASTNAHMQGRVTAAKGRRVVVRSEGRDVTCILSGQRAVVGDQVLFLDAPGQGGKLTEVLPRTNALTRCEPNGREEVLATNLGGLLVCASVEGPPYRPGLVDRYQVGASADELGCVLVLTKSDLGIPADVEEDLALREAAGMVIHRVSCHTGQGLPELRSWLATASAAGPWALVGHSGVGKTSLIGALMPGHDVGPIGEISAYWDQGRHTTVGARLFELGDGAELVDSPGIRSFLPGGLTAMLVRDHFPGLGPCGCRYRDCLHREGEDGCAAATVLAPPELLRYRRLLAEVTEIDARRRP